MLRTARRPRPPPVRTLPARERGPSKDVYVVVDWRPLKDEDTDTSAKKAKHRPVRHLTEEALHRARSHSLLRPNKCTARHSRCSSPLFHVHLPASAFCDAGIVRPEEAPKSITFGPRGGVVAGAKVLRRAPTDVPSY